jgi:thiamine biosynthesis lipoprotein
MLMRVPAAALRPHRRPVEVVEAFPCFGTTCRVIVLGDGALGSATDAAAHARDTLLAWHAAFTRFEPSSELSALNADPRARVPASDTMLAFVDAARDAAELSGGLVDPTLGQDIVDAGYDADLDAPSLSLSDALAIAPARRAASADPAGHWRALSADHADAVVTRPPGLSLDGGGILKGLFADLLASRLASYERVVIDCGGDLRMDGAHPVARIVEITDPFDRRVATPIEVTSGAVATSGIGARRWLAADGAPAHHLLDPSTGRPAFTGLVQVSALAPTAVRAEALAKAALLSGPAGLPTWLPHGGIAVSDDGSVTVVDPEGILR